MKIIKIMLAIALCMVFTLSFSANVIVNSELYYQEEDITVVFEPESVLTNEQKQLIADKIVSGDPIVDDGASTYAWCWLTGHDIVSETVFEVEHKASDTDPRCKKNTYIVDTCSKCDYLEYTLFSSSWILCCPEE